MSTYDRYICQARKVNLINRLIKREVVGQINKIESALCTANRTFSLSAIDKKGYLTLNYNGRRCPYIYEAEAIDFAINLKYHNDNIAKCKKCRRALHPLIDLKQDCCSRCNV